MPDLAKPIVGAAICVRVLEFEYRLNRWIEGRFRDSDQWKERLHENRLKPIRKLHERAQQKRIEGRMWRYGTIGDKMTILKVEAESREPINDLRNAVFHTRPPSEVRAALEHLARTEEKLEQQHG